MANDVVRIEMPSWNPYVRYSKGQYQLKVPFAMYADFEFLLTEPSDEEGGMDAPTCIVNMHEPSGWCGKSVFVHREVSNPIATYSGKDCIEKFC